MCVDAPPAPDPAIGQAAASNAEISREALEFYKQRWEDTKPYYDKMAELATATAEQQQAIAQENHDLSKDYADYQRNTFRPLEQGIVDDAQNYDTPERRDAEAGEAMQGVATQFDAARSNMAKTAAAMGVNPGSGNYLSQMKQMAVQEAATKAASGNKARDDVELQGYARKMDAANLGRGLASNQATSAGVALNAGNSAVGTASAPISGANAHNSMMGQGFSTGIQGNNSAGSLYGQQFNAQMQGYNAQQQATAGMWGALGSGAGLLTGGFF